MFIARIRMSNCYPDEPTGRYFKGWYRRYTEQEVGAHICFTAQSGSGIPRSPYQVEIELRGQIQKLNYREFNLRSPFHGLKNRCKTYVCAHFLFCIPSVPSLKIPACWLVRIAITHPDSCDKQQYKAELLCGKISKDILSCYFPLSIL